MGGTEPVVGDDDESVGVLDEELAATLHCAVREAAHRLGAEAAAVYLLTPDGTELRAAMIGGGLPAVHTLPGRMALDSFYASARALADGRVALLADPDPWTEPGDGERARPYPYPYTVASVPLEAEGHRFGSLTVLRAEERGGYGGADCERLGRIGQRLAVGLTGLLDAGTAITPGRLPVLVPVFRSGPSAEPDEEPPWGAPGVAGSAGLSLMYPLQRLADVLNRATAMDHVTAAAELCVMAPFGPGPWCWPRRPKAGSGCWGTAGTPRIWSGSSTAVGCTLPRSPVGPCGAARCSRPAGRAAPVPGTTRSTPPPGFRSSGAGTWSICRLPGARTSSGSAAWPSTDRGPFAPRSGPC